MPEFGVPPSVWGTDMDSETGLTVKLTIGDATYNATYGNWDIFKAAPFLPLIWCLLMGKGREFITLRDIVQQYKAHNEPAILKLLDEWENVHGPLGPGPRSYPSGQDEATMARITNLNEGLDEVQEAMAGKDGCNKQTTLPAGSKEDSACDSEQLPHSQACDIDKGTYH